MTSSSDTTKKGRILRGTVVSAKMQDTIVVAVVRYVKHPKYQKFLKRVKRYLAHDPENRYQEGERVAIRESRPLSKRKHFVVVEEESAASGKDGADA